MLGCPRVLSEEVLDQSRGHARGTCGSGALFATSLSRTGTREVLETLSGLVAGNDLARDADVGADEHIVAKANLELVLVEEAAEKDSYC